MSIALFVVLLLISLALSAMVAAYDTLSISHLRHWARKHDSAAEKLYPLKARGSAALLTLELLRAISIAVTVTFLAVMLSPWLAGLVLAIIFFGAFVVLTRLYLKNFGIQLLVWLSAPLLYITHVLKHLMLPLGRSLDRFLADEPVILTKSDLHKKLKNVSEDDTDLDSREIGMLQKALMFNSQKIHDVMQTKAKLSLISINEVLTPVVLDELHKSAQDFFPVMGSDHKTVVGLLMMQDVMEINQNPSVAETMQKAQFIDEEESLLTVVDQFIETKQPVFIVTNGEGMLAGLISIDMILKELVGQKVTDEVSKESVEETEPQASTDDSASEQIAESGTPVVE